MLKRTLQTIIISALAATSFVAHAGDIVIENAYINAPPPVAKVAAGFLTISNHGSKSVRIESISSPVAGKVEVHKTEHEHGQMKMRQVKALEIASHESVELTPGDMHLMLMKLKQTLSPGDATEIALHFSNGEVATVTAEVRDMREQHNTDHQQHHGHH